jgi:hypothetical protein
MTRVEMVMGWVRNQLRKRKKIKVQLLGAAVNRNGSMDRDSRGWRRKWRLTRTG